MSEGELHLVKLCVGAESIRDLAEWQARRMGESGQPPRHVTRMWPRRDKQLLKGGSLYWVIKGIILVRQRIAALEEVRGTDGIRRCAIIFDPALIRTEAQPRRPFQGWRYFKAADTPRDLAPYSMDEPDLPAELQAGITALGVL